MASAAPAPKFCPGDLVVYRGFKTCAMVGVCPTFGFNRYSVMDLDNGASITAYAHELAPASLDNIVLQEVEFVEVESLGLQPPKKRFKQLSTNEIDKLAAQRTEKSTDRQTNWAVKLFRGKYWQPAGLFIWQRMVGNGRVLTASNFLWPVTRPDCVSRDPRAGQILATKCGSQSKCGACHKEKNLPSWSIDVFRCLDFFDPMVWAL